MASDLQVVEALFRCGHRASIQARASTPEELTKVKSALGSRLCYECQLARAQAGFGPEPPRRVERHYSGGARWAQRDRSRR